MLDKLVAKAGVHVEAERAHKGRDAVQRVGRRNEIDNIDEIESPPACTTVRPASYATLNSAPSEERVRARTRPSLLVWP